MASKDPSVAGYGRCPICGSKAEAGYRPFCSVRCRDVDLGRWLGGAYAIPGGEASDEDGEEAGARSARGDVRDRDDDDEAS
jgi:endogenous inhibitor of DNA gyrase (YacG/DUF329 family)